jgi:hypothetical protein
MATTFQATKVSSATDQMPGIGDGQGLKCVSSVFTVTAGAALVINEAPEERRSELFDANVARIQQAFINGDRTYESLVRAYIQSPAGLDP